MKKITNYKNKHIITIVFVIYLVMGQIFTLEGIWNFITMLVYCAVIGQFLGTGIFEKKDELTKKTLSKATEITFFVLLAVLFICAIILQNIDSAILGSDMCFYSLLGAIGLRSIVFLILDRTPKETDDEENEE